MSKHAQDEPEPKLAKDFDDDSEVGHDFGPTPVWRVNKDGSSRLVDPADSDDNLGDVIEAIVNMANELRREFFAIPDVMAVGHFSGAA